MRKRTIIVSFFLLFLSSILRLYRISELTEFLGDQGRTGIVIYEAWVSKTVPLAGPTVLSGQHLGPFFYYLMAPSFILSNFNPAVPAIFTALLGILTVLLMFYIANKLFGFWLGFLISTLYSVSPSIVTQDRILWEPNVIPFFILLFTIALYKIRKERNFKYFLLLGISVGILIQLHYPNIFFIFLTILFLFYIAIRILLKYHHPRSPLRQRFGQAGHLGGTKILWALTGAFGFFLMLSPFLLYETQHQFIDLKEITLIFLGANTTTTSSQPIYFNILDISSRLFKNVIPFHQSWYFSLAQLLIILFPILHLRGDIARHIRDYRFWHFFFVVWFVAGVFGVSMYKGVIFDHYLMFLLPVPYFLLGYFLKTLNTFIPKEISMTTLVVLIIINISRTDIFSKGNNDLLRTQLMSNAIIQQSNNKAFSFTLISSRSFSDLHYRYYLKVKNVEPKPIVSKNYSLLFLVCEKSPCPAKEEMERMQEVQVLCYDPHCEEKYPKINLKEFSLNNSRDVFDGRIFTYRRNQIR